jgi:hypothetical protein
MREYLATSYEGLYVSLYLALQSKQTADHLIHYTMLPYRGEGPLVGGIDSSILQ